MYERIEANRSVKALVVLAIVFYASFMLLITIAGSADKLPGKKAKPRQESGDPNLIAVPPPPFSEGIFPCSECHADLETDTTPRKLEEMHEDIVFTHDAENRWCLACHDVKNRDKLHLVGGKPVAFTESYKLCGQCHGPKLRDWKAGEHGKRTGSWSGKKQYLLCVHCHDSHSPRFKPLQPLPPPVRPENLRKEHG